MIRNILCVNKIFLWLTWALVFIPTDAKSFQSISGTSGVATQRKIIHLGQFLKSKPNFAPRVNDVEAVHPPLKRSKSNSATPRTKIGSSTSAGAPRPFAGEPPTLVADFSALGDDGTSIPPDTHGAVGPNHLMVTLNTDVRIQDRDGTNMSTVDLDTFWSGFFNSRTFDPKVLYDHMADRWMVTAMADPAASTSSVLIGVSQTSDPTGLWNIYRIDADASNISWADYPSIGFNKDWIVIQINMFAISGSDFTGSQIYVFDKSDLYAGGTGAFTLFEDNVGFTQTPAITYDDTLSTLYLVEQWVPDENYDLVNKLRISTITGAVGAETYLPGTAIISIPEAWDDEAAQTNFGPQTGTSLKIMLNDARIQNTVYRNGALWTVHTIFLPAGNSENRSAIQWWQIDPTGFILQRGRLDDPTGTDFYGYPSIAVNKNNAAMIGYSSFSSNQYASSNFVFRNSDDPINTLQEDTLLKAGEAKYSKTFGTGRNRWGDYSNTVVDPTNDTSMWTIQQYAALPSSGSDRWGTWWGHIVPPAAEPDIAVDLGSINYGGVDLESVRSIDLTIRNSSAAVLSVTQITNASNEFSSNSLSGTIAPGDSILHSISFSSLITGVYQDTLTIVSNDPQKPLLQIPLSATAVRRADINNDESISVLDVIVLVRQILGKTPPPQSETLAFYTSDANDDGQLNILDVVNVVNRILGLLPKLVNNGSTEPVLISLETSAHESYGNRSINIRIQTDKPLVALHFSILLDQINFKMGIPYLHEAFAQMILTTHQAQDKLEMVIYSMDGSLIHEGKHTIAILPLLPMHDSPAPENLQITQVTAVDRNAQSIRTEVMNSTRPSQQNPFLFILNTNRPNPFNPQTQISYVVPEESHLTIRIYNLLGQEITTLVYANHIPGKYKAIWNGKNKEGHQVASGIYLYQMTTDTGFTTTKRMTLLR